MSGRIYRRRQTMQQDDIQATLAEIFEKVAKVERAAVVRDKRLQEDLGIDSLTLIDLAVATEDAFAVGIPDEELERFQTVGDIVDHIRRCRVAA
jgi:acyl carrier protein